MRIKNLHHVGICVRDTRVATEFYVGVLGFRANSAKTNWLSLDNGQAIHLMPATDHSDPGRDVEDLARHIALEVESLEDTVLLLLRHGLAPFQSGLELAQRRYLTDAGDLSFGIGTVFVADPDENVVEFVDPARGIFATVPPV